MEKMNGRKHGISGLMGLSPMIHAAPGDGEMAQSEMQEARAILVHFGATGSQGPRLASRILHSLGKFFPVENGGIFFFFSATSA